MPFQTNIYSYLKAEKLNVIEVAGWQTRGREIFNPRGSVNHHTAGPVNGDHPSLKVLINGRPDLPGPLCNVSLARNGDVYLIAAGRANHAGSGGWQGLSGNSSVWGLEVEHAGVLAKEKFPDQDQLDRMYRIHAAFAKCSGFNAKMVCQHFEWTTRKIDFVSMNGDAFRRSVQATIDMSSTPTDEEDDMKRWIVWSAGDNGDLTSWLYNGATRQKISGSIEAQIHAFHGAKHLAWDSPEGKFLGAKPGDIIPFNWTAAQINAIPVEDGFDLDVDALASSIASKVKLPPSGGVSVDQIRAVIQEELRRLRISQA